MDDQQYKSLARKIDDLILLCNQLDQENRRLKADAATWQQEREQLTKKTDMARDKVESMINRLKALEAEA